MAAESEEPTIEISDDIELPSDQEILARAAAIEDRGVTVEWPCWKCDGKGEHRILPEERGEFEEMTVCSDCIEEAAREHGLIA